MNSVVCADIPLLIIGAATWQKSLLPDSQFLCSHLSLWMATMRRASICQKDGKSALPIHATLVDVSCRAHDVLDKCAASIWARCEVSAGLL